MCLVYFENGHRIVHIVIIRCLFHLCVGTHIIVITSAKEVGKYLGFPVFRVQSLKCLPCNQALKQLSPQEVRFTFSFPSLSLFCMSHLLLANML